MLVVFDAHTKNVNLMDEELSSDDARPIEHYALMEIQVAQCK